MKFSGLAAAAFTAILISGYTANLSAQTIRGVVVDDSTKLPLQGAVATLLNSRGADAGKPPVRSDSLGRFTLHAGEMGRYQVRVTRIGYQPVTSQNLSFTFGGHVLNVTLNMSATTTKLSTVIVTSTTRLNNLELLSHVGFDLRKSKGNGKFFDSTALAEYGRQPAGWFLEENKVLFGLEVVSGGTGPDVLRMMRGATMCAPEVWIDGFLANSNTALQRLMGLGVDLTYGIEVYSGLQLPPPSLGGEMGATFGNASPSRRCGVVAVWTKGYAKEMQAKADAKKAPGGGGGLR